MVCTLFAIAQAAAQQPNPLPAGTVTIVVPLAAGGPSDAMARMLADKLSPRIGRTVVVENKAGAGGNLGAASVANAAPNGLTWLFTVDSVMTVNPHIYASQGFDARKDLVPVARFGFNLLILAVNAGKVPARSFPELLAASKSRPVNFGSAGLGSPGHVAFEYLKMTTGLNGNHIPYRGANPVLNDLMGGNIEAAFITAGATLPHIKSGVLRALATSADTRIASLPDVPTADEAGITGFEARFSNYLLAPAATKPEIQAFMSMQIKDIIALPEVRERLVSLSTEPVFADANEAQALMARDREKWGKVVAATGMKQNQ